MQACLLVEPQVGKYELEYTISHNVQKTRWNILLYIFVALDEHLDCKEVKGEFGGHTFLSSGCRHPPPLATNIHIEQKEGRSMQTGTQASNFRLNTASIPFKTIAHLNSCPRQLRISSAISKSLNTLSPSLDTATVCHPHRYSFLPSRNEQNTMTCIPGI